MRERQLIRSGRAVLLCAALGLQVAGCATGVESSGSRLPVQGNEEWALVFSDEFDGTMIDRSKWVINGPVPRKGGYWSPDDAYLDGEGHLVLRTRREGDKVLSGALSTAGLFEQRYGYWEIRCRFPTEPGHWPAFWLYAPGVMRVGDAGRDGSEIDIFEKPSREDVIVHTIHWDGYEESHQAVSHTVRREGLSDGFHTFGLRWTPSEYSFYVDGTLTWRTRAGGVSQIPQHMYVTAAVDTWAGDIDDASLPDYFEVDWVRVYRVRNEVE